MTKAESIHNERLELAFYATRWEFGKIECGISQYKIEIRSWNPNLYCILKGNNVWNNQIKNWVWEMQPSSRTADFLFHTRFTLLFAYRLLKQIMKEEHGGPTNIPKGYCDIAGTKPIGGR